MLDDPTHQLPPTVEIRGKELIFGNEEYRRMAPGTVYILKYCAYMGLPLFDATEYCSKDWLIELSFQEVFYHLSTLVTWQPFHVQKVSIEFVDQDEAHDTMEALLKFPHLVDITFTVAWFCILPSPHYESFLFSHPQQTVRLSLFANFRDTSESKLFQVTPTLHARNQICCIFNEDTSVNMNRQLLNFAIDTSYSLLKSGVRMDLDPREECEWSAPQLENYLALCATLQVHTLTVEPFMLPLETVTEVLKQVHAKHIILKSGFDLCYLIDWLLPACESNSLIQTLDCQPPYLLWGTRFCDSNPTKICFIPSDWTAREVTSMAKYMLRIEPQLLRFDHKATTWPEHYGPIFQLPFHVKLNDEEVDHPDFDYSKVKMLSIYTPKKETTPLLGCIYLDNLLYWCKDIKLLLRLFEVAPHISQLEIALAQVEDYPQIAEKLAKMEDLRTFTSGYFLYRYLIENASLPPNLERIHTFLPSPTPGPEMGCQIDIAVKCKLFHLTSLVLRENKSAENLATHIDHFGKVTRLESLLHIPSASLELAMNLLPITFLEFPANKVDVVISVLKAGHLHLAEMKPMVPVAEPFLARNRMRARTLQSFA